MTPCRQPHRLQADGTFVHLDGIACDLDEIASSDIEVTHLANHVVTFSLPKGDHVNVLITLTCHCWTDGYDAEIHGAACVKIMDHTRPRAFSKERYDQSVMLPAFLLALQTHRCLLTPEERNYVAYNASVTLDDSRSYRVFFTVRQDKGRFNGVRHALRLTVESAYLTSDEVFGSKIAFDHVLGSALRGEKTKYRR